MYLFAYLDAILVYITSTITGDSNFVIFFADALQEM